jgi:chromosome segregation ATPase
MNVKVSLGNKLFNSENLLNEANGRIKELTQILGEREEENKSLMSENKMLKSIIKQNEEVIQSLKSDKEMLKDFLNKREETIQETNVQFDYLNNNYKDSLEVNKKLKSEIEILIDKIDTNKNNNVKYARELEDLEKIKNKFENDLIEVTTKNNNLIEKIKVYENVLKQKEKYINILIKKKEPYTQMISTIDTNLDTIVTRPTNVNKKINNTLMQNKINDYEEKLAKKDEEIKKLEIDKNNLITRLRNSKILK